MNFYFLKGQHDVGGTTCVVTVWKSVPPSGPEFQKNICKNKKRCFGLVFGASDADLDQLGANIYEPTLPFKYSRAVNWILLKPIKGGSLIQINCKNNTKAAKFPMYENKETYAKFKIPEKHLKMSVFDVCIKPKEGEGITASFFHLVPLINILEVPGEIVSFLKK